MAQQKPFPVKVQFAAISGLQKIHAPQKGGLAGTAGPQDGNHIALVHLQINLLQNFKIPERLSDLCYFQHHWFASLRIGTQLLFADTL